MPRAGWCRECRRWVWVNENDECQFGHSADCVESVHEVEQAPQRKVGDGDFPAELDRFNWGAYLLPVVWGAVYGVWPLIGAWGLALLSSMFLYGLVPAVNEVPEVRGFIMASIGVSMVVSAVRLWAGYRANRLMWKRNVIVAQLSETLSARRPTLQRFEERQIMWARIGWIVLIAGTVAMMPVVYEAWEPYGLGAVGVAREIVWLIAEVGAAWWLAIKMREERTEGVSANGDTPANGGAR